MRRMTGRTPPFALIGLTVVIFILGYNYWTLSSQCDDLKKEIERLQAQLKLSDVRQEQVENKNTQLQGNIHDIVAEKNVQVEKFERLLQTDEEQLKTGQIDIKKKAYEITSLKNNGLKAQETERDLHSQLEERDIKIEELQKNIQHILTLKNDAEEALSERDYLYNEIKRKLEQAETQISRDRKEDLAASKSKVPGPFNIPNAEKKDVDKKGSSPLPAVNHENFLDTKSLLKKYSQDKAAAKNNDILYNVIPNPPIAKAYSPASSIGAKPNVSPMMMGAVQKPLILKANNNDVFQKPNFGLRNAPPLFRNYESPAEEGVLHEPETNGNGDLTGGGERDGNHVLPPPPQNPEDNPDTALDDGERVIEDPLDDQDEEGKEIKRDMNRAEENYDNYDEKGLDDKANYDDPNGVLGIPRGILPQQGNDVMEDHKGEVLDDQGFNEKMANKHHGDLNIVEDNASNHAHENIYDNFEKKIRNMKKHL